RMPPPLKLPVLQNWSCHSCAGCCRQHAIEITEEERQRIISQGWESQPGYGPNEPIFVWNSGPIWKKRYRLAHRADGGCVFLDEKGLCRIHAKFGEPAKPLACRIYPYAFHPAGKQVTVSLRFSCPSVVANRGTPLTENQKELKQLERLVVPQGVEKLPAPKISSRQRLDWPDFLQFVEHLDSTLADSSQPIMVKLLRALFWMGLVGQSRFDVIQGDRLE
ncbi:MAG TPA: YkgJ family cysteine cluster protein, partial [Planctomycetaceae bacterium]|nr:YkgJ family cysteine cluster protein [Planctomycetaceae bacterium]